MENMKILTSLDSLRESIEEKFGWENEESDERTIAEHMSSYCGPRIGYRFFVERIDDLKDLIESTSKIQRLMTEQSPASTARMSLHSDRLPRTAAPH